MRLSPDAPPESQPRPNFFLVGASKAGTTSLYNYLSQHPQIFMSPVKEPHFFADEVRKENFAPENRKKLDRWEAAFRDYLRSPMSTRFPSGPVSDWHDYLKLFQCAGDRPVIGEASPCYLWSRTAPGNIAAQFPDAKIVMVLRNPAERAFAQHLHTLSFATVPISFQEQMDAARRSTRRQIGDLYPFLEFGFYGEQIERYFNLFARDKIAIFLYEEFRSDPLNLIRNIFRFLGVDETFVPDMSERHMTARVPRSFGLNRFLRQSGIRDLAGTLVSPALRGVMSTAVFRPRTAMALDPLDRTRLVDFYRDDIGKLSTLLGKNLSEWLG
jgi:hypothetical protein